MRGLLPTPSAKLLKLNLSFNLLFVLAGIVIPTAANAAFKPYKIVRIFSFCHVRFLFKRSGLQNLTPRQRAVVETPTLS